MKAPHATTAEKLRSTELADALQRLNPRMRHVLQRRFGLDGRPAETLEEVGAGLGITRERVRQFGLRARTRAPDGRARSRALPPGPSSSSSLGAFVRAARSTAPATTAANDATRAAPIQPDGSGSWKSTMPAAIGSAFVSSVERPAVVSALPRWKAAWRTAVPAP